MNHTPRSNRVKRARERIAREGAAAWAGHPVRVAVTVEAIRRDVLGPDADEPPAEEVADGEG